MYTATVIRQIRKVYLLNYLVLGVGAMVMIFPFLWMVSTSLKPRGDIFSYPPALWPETFTLEHYRDAFTRLDLARLYWNTGYVSIIKTFLMVYTGALLGFVFGKYQFRGRDALFFLVFLTMIIPLEVYMIPLYQMMVTAQLGNTHAALILPGIFSAYAIFMFRQFMFTIPNDLLDAARIDGASEISIFHRIILPLSTPALATMTIFYFMWNWNDFLWPLIVITTGKKAMLPVALAGFVAEHGNNFGLIMAGATMTVLPITIVFLALQRYIIDGIAITGLK